MPYCSKCGNKISETAKFCNTCGENISIGNDSMSQINLEDKLIPKKDSIHPKTIGYILLFSLIVIVGLVFVLFKDSGENKYDSDGNKHGNWIEYINADGSMEVSKSSAKFIRHITYFHGLPKLKEVVKDYYPSGKIQSEFELLSTTPYQRNQSRPRDYFIGYCVYFDEQTSKIIGFSYYNNGKVDLQMTVTKAYEMAVKDPRYDKDFFAKTEFGVSLLKYLGSSIQESSEGSSNLVNEQNTYSYPDNLDHNSRQSGKQKVACYKCNGTGKAICSDCNGKGVVVCGTCNGSGKFNAGHGLETCYYCNGTKWVPCNHCGGKGITGYCSECSGKGYIFQ